MGLSLSAAACGAALAQTSGAAPKESSGKSGTANKVSNKDMATIKMCKEMSHDAMMKDQKCMAMMKMHPDMMKAK
jgi:hypothetical protein